MIWLIILAAVVLFALLFCLALTLVLFRGTVCRYPADPAGEDAEAPVKMAKSWEPYRAVFQQGKRWYLGAERERVEIESTDGIPLVGHLIRPEGEPVGCILLMHGFHGNPYHDFGPILPFYHDRGYLLLIPDERAHGESGGKYITYGIKERWDCLCWCRYLAGRFGTDMPLFLDGISMGAAIVLMASSLPLPENVRGIIADCGYTSPYAIMRHVLKHRLHLPVFPILQMAEVLFRLLAGFGLREYSTLEAMETNPYPVLFVHGLADDFVPSYMTEENYRACRAEKEVMYAEGAGHGLSYLVMRPECEERLERFLLKHSEQAAGRYGRQEDKNKTEIEQE